MNKMGRGDDGGEGSWGEKNEVETKNEKNEGKGM